MGGCLSCKHLTGSVPVQACLLEWVHALVCVCCLLTKPICMQMYECRMLWQHTFLTMGELWCCTCISRSSKITTENRGIFPPSLSQLHHEKRKFIRRRNKHRSRQNSPPQLVSNFIKLLDVFLAENSHVVRALPPSSPDHRHVLRNVHPLRASSQRHHPYQQPPVWAGLQATVLLMLELPTRVKRSRKKKTFRPRRRNLTAADEEEEEEGCGGERESEREREREREKGVRPVNKRRPNWLSNEPAPPGRRHDSWSWSVLPAPAISTIFPGSRLTCRALTAASLFVF